MTYPSNYGSDTEGQLKSFVDRVMRMREEAKEKNDDIREIYAEAKACGFDKTILGKVVAHLEKVAKDPSAVAEQGALFDLYLGVVTGTVVATHVHEEPLDHDPQTGEITESRTDAVAAVGFVASLAGVEGDEDRQPIPETAPPIPSKHRSFASYPSRCRSCGGSSFRSQPHHDRRPKSRNSSPRRSDLN